MEQGPDSLAWVGAIQEARREQIQQAFKKKRLGPRARVFWVRRVSGHLPGRLHPARLLPLSDRGHSIPSLATKHSFPHNPFLLHQPLVFGAMVHRDEAFETIFSQYVKITSAAASGSDS